MWSPPSRKPARSLALSGCCNSRTQVVRQFVVAVLSTQSCSEYPEQDYFKGSLLSKFGRLGVLWVRYLLGLTQALQGAPARYRMNPFATPLAQPLSDLDARPAAPRQGLYDSGPHAALLPLRHPVADRRYVPPHCRPSRLIVSTPSVPPLVMGTCQQAHPAARAAHETSGLIARLTRRYQPRRVPAGPVGLSYSCNNANRCKSFLEAFHGSPGTRS